MTLPPPGSNPGGTNVAVPSAAGAQSTPSVGSSTNPFLTPVPTGQSTFPQTQAPAPATALASNFASGLGMPGTGGFPAENDFVKAMHKAGFSAGDAAMLWNFLQSGAGFNPQIAQTLWDAGAKVRQGQEETYLEQFGGRYGQMGGGVAPGFGLLLGQEEASFDAVMGQLAEQATQNFLSVLLAGKGPAPPSLLQNILTGTQILDNIAKLGSISLPGAGGSTATIGSCWIAEAVWGKTPATWLVRVWLNTRFIKHPAGRVVMALYRRFGRGVARFISKHPAAQKAARFLMTPVLERATLDLVTALKGE